MFLYKTKSAFWTHKGRFSDETRLFHWPQKVRHDVTPWQGTPGPGSSRGPVHHACFPRGWCSGGQCSPMDAVNWLPSSLISTVSSCPTFRRVVPWLRLLGGVETTSPGKAPMSKTEPPPETYFCCGTLHFKELLCSEFEATPLPLRARALRCCYVVNFSQWHSHFFQLSLFHQHE